MDRNTENIPFGKRIKSDVNEIMFLRFPGSSETETLPAGRPSGKIDSWIQKDGKGYFVTEYTDEKNAYIEDNDRLKIVDENAEDESSFFNSTFSGISDFIGNSSRTVEKNAGFISTGFEDATGQLKDDISKFGNNLKLSGIVAVPFLLLFLAFYFMNKLD